MASKELPLSSAFLMAVCSSCPFLRNLPETEKEFRSTELSQMTGDKAHK